MKTSLHCMKVNDRLNSTSVFTTLKSTRRKKESRKNYMVDKYFINSYKMDILHHSKYKRLIYKFIYWI
jgi:hypothetical protein